MLVFPDQTQRAEATRPYHSAMSKAVGSSGQEAKLAGERPASGKQRVLEAAERLFASKGFLGVSASEIVTEAGVAHGLLFHHFGSMEDLYAEVSRVAAMRMDEAQLKSFRGATARTQIEAFLRSHMRAMRKRQGDALFRARALDAGVSSRVGQIWEESRQRAISRVFEALGIETPSNRLRVCLRGWIGFHDQLVLAWLADRSVSEAEVLAWTLRQLEHLAVDVLRVDLDRPLSDVAPRRDLEPLERA
jgi:AcrR family transcriptional regulator